MKFENTEVFNFHGAFRGMRNPKESWDLSDSKYDEDGNFIIGKNDRKLARNLILGGPEHSKFMRQIFVCVDITAPLYWWKEFDTYKVGTVANSCSTMFKLASTPITKECFETTWPSVSADARNSEDYWREAIKYMESLRQEYNRTENKVVWKRLIEILPTSWLQKRTVTMNYQNLLAICSIGQRRHHKLTEWSVDFMDWARSLPNSDLIFESRETIDIL